MRCRTGLRALALDTVVKIQMDNYGTAEEFCSLEDKTCKGDLAIDHILGNGSWERQYLKAVAFFNEIIRGHYPTNQLRLLCHSHNTREGLV